MGKLCLPFAQYDAGICNLYVHILPPSLFSAALTAWRCNIEYRLCTLSHCDISTQSFIYAELKTLFLHAFLLILWFDMKFRPVSMVF
jgi:hypothetical protein